jgi:hypothetical protein
MYAAALRPLWVAIQMAVSGQLLCSMTVSMMRSVAVPAPVGLPAIVVTPVFAAMFVAALVGWRADIVMGVAEMVAVIAPAVIGMIVMTVQMVAEVKTAPGQYECRIDAPETMIVETVP